jgi:Nif-specific regulatory protein
MAHLFRTLAPRSERVRVAENVISPVSPSLVAVAGPLQGASRPLSGDETSIGRDLGNTVSIADASVSRRHCVVRSENGDWMVRDLDSLNGTFVNGVPVKERRLAHGDQIQVGTSLLLFLLRDGVDGGPAGSVRLSDGGVRLGSTATLNPEKAPRLGEETSARGLSALLRACRLVSASRTPEELGSRTTEIALEICRADRAALLLTSEASDEFAVVVGRDRSQGTAAPMTVSRTVVSRVFREREAIVSNEVHADAALSEVESLVGLPVRALAAVPVGLERPVGVLYADSSDAAAPFSQRDLGLLQALGDLAASAVERLRANEWRHAERDEPGAGQPISALVGESPAMKRVEQFLARVAPSEATVLLLGESGTGKELAAQAIHRNSPRASRPFVAVNCAALSEQLLESEFFGHERGAFTGAIAQKKGKLEMADGGTVFLDEVGELSPALQAKLLRVLEERQFDRVGGVRPIRVDIRLVAATNRDLKEAIAADRFREDLYYRLNVVELTLPPLRERPSDIPLLASYFAARFARKSNRKTPSFTPEARACLLRYDWPGNVRELSNAIERAVVLGGDVVGTEDLPEAVLDAGQSGDVALGGYHAAVLETKKRVIRKAVEEASGNYTEAARRLGVHPNYLHRLIRNLDLKADLKR